MHFLFHAPHEYTAPTLRLPLLRTTQRTGLVAEVSFEEALGQAVNHNARVRWSTQGRYSDSIASLLRSNIIKSVVWIDLARIRRNNLLRRPLHGSVPVLAVQLHSAYETFIKQRPIERDP
jgi:hypothetical protein